jgi:hypothetical protein
LLHVRKSTNVDKACRIAAAESRASTRDHAEQTPR